MNFCKEKRASFSDLSSRNINLSIISVASITEEFTSLKHKGYQMSESADNTIIKQLNSPVQRIQCHNTLQKRLSEE
jgi:hypothetical protein